MCNCMTQGHQAVNGILELINEYELKSRAPVRVKTPEQFLQSLTVCICKSAGPAFYVALKSRASGAPSVFQNKLGHGLFQISRNKDAEIAGKVRLSLDIKEGFPAIERRIETVLQT